MRLIRRLTLLALLAMALPFAATVIFALTYRAPEAPRAAAIVVLSGNALYRGELVGATLGRTEAGIDLWRRGAAPLLVMSGGTTDRRRTLIVGARMRDHALAAGLPPEAVLTEGASHSTLQNALFSARLPGIDPAQPVIVVTERYHLPRAWASFHWAGFRDVTLWASDSGPLRLSDDVLAEAVKWPANALRAAGVSLARLAGVPDSRTDPLLQ